MTPAQETDRKRAAILITFFYHLAFSLSKQNGLLPHLSFLCKGTFPSSAWKVQGSSMNYLPFSSDSRNRNLLENGEGNIKQPPR